MDNAIAEGAVSPPVVIIVDPAPLQAALGGEPGGPAIPPTLPAAWWQQIPQPWLTPGLLPILREQSVDLIRPLVAGEQLTCAVRVERVRRRGAHQFVDCMLEARSAAGDLVATALTRLAVVEP